MRATLIAVLCGTALLTPGPASAYGVDDPGQAKCALFVRMMEKGPRGTEYQFLSWAQGYIAALQKANSDAAPRTFSRSAMASFESYCHQHGEALFPEAVESAWLGLQSTAQAVAGQ